MRRDQTSADDMWLGGGEMGLLMRTVDWDSTPLKAPETWPQSLRSIVRMMLTSRYQMWMGWGPQLTFFCNDAYSPTLGVKHPWALAKPTSEVWREIWPDIGPMIDHVLATGEATYSEGMLLILQRSGFPEETYHTFSYSPLFDDGNHIAGLFCVVVEETNRIINERRLDTLRGLASAAAATRTEPELFAAVGRQLQGNLKDLPFTLVYLFDEAGEARLAASSGMPEGHPAAPVILAPGQGWLDQPGVARLVEDLQARFGDLPSGDWDAAPRQALLTPILQSGHAAPAGFLVAGVNAYRPLDQAYQGFVDLIAGQIGAALTSARAFEEERKRAEALAELDRAKTAFFSNISHEFRTPLTLLLGPLDDLLAAPEGLDPYLLDQLRLAQRNGARLLRLVNSLLDFSRIEAGRVQANLTPTDIAAYSAEIASSFRSAMERAGLSLTIDAPPLPGSARVDREMWEKILLNLLSNAFKFTFEGGVTVSVRPAGAHVEVKVTDTGSGIPPEELPRLFERFHRVENAKGRSIEGSGIGLALVQELVKLHDGTIRVESEVGRGASFTVSLPLDAAAAVDAPVGVSGAARAFLEEASRWLPGMEGSDSAGVDAAQRPGHGRRVLLADDNPDMRDYVRRLLIAEGYAVEAVADGQAALEAARRAAPDLILSDVMMPVLDGFGLLKAVRDDAALSRTPVLLLSARAGEEARIEGIEAGADDYLVKPFAARELLARVTGAIQLARARREAERAILASEQRYLMTQERLSLALSTGRVAVFEWDVDDDHLILQGPLAEAFGVAQTDAAVGLPLADFVAGIHPDDTERVLALVNRAVETNGGYEAEYRILGGGQARTVLARGQVEATPEGRRMAGALIDITEEKEAEATLRASQADLQEQTRALTVMNRAGAAIAGNFDLASLVQTITDAGVELTKAEFGAFFYNVLDSEGERYTLYTLSGAPREAFERFPMPRNTDVFAPTFKGEGVIRSDDITLDPRYGRNAPRKGMPEGHLPVRSYLAVPVKSRTGEVLGGLFFGHSEVGVFDARAEELMAGLAGQTAVVMDNARLFQELQQLNQTLAARVEMEVAERSKAEEALRQAQKMEAVGQLTGGVAHDFNNLLTVIIGGLDTIRRSRPEDEARIRRAADMALQGAQRAASLTGRLLAFARRQPLDPKPLDLNLLIRDMTELLHRTLGETIELEGVLASRLWSIEVDQNQLEAAVINLAVNARDAMPDGGKLTIETANTLLDETYSATDAEVIPGQYVMVAVSDTGSGMDAEALARAFEPFFTTKAVGRGTGLGLSMVYGFVKQSGGHVTLYSEPGHGTTVRMYFPRFRGEAEIAPTQTSSPIPRASQGETVLVVEDNDDVRAYSLMVLTELGYEVLSAETAEAGLEFLKGPQRVDLLFTDVVLPGDTGRVLADQATVIRPGLKVLYTTGYSRNAIVHHGRLDAGVNLITKPFTFEELAVRVRAVLDGT